VAIDPPADERGSLDERRPGIGRDASVWLADHGVRAVGTDSYSIEICQPRAEGTALMPAHVELLVRRGVFIFEALDLEGLAAAGSTHFLFVALPMRVEGATGSPVQPIAII
jgi:kynurenine formamidase